MRRRTIGNDKYQVRCKWNEYDASDYCRNVASRIPHRYEIRSFGNDVGCQYEDATARNRAKHRKVAEQMYLIDSHEMTGIPSYFHNDYIHPTYTSNPRAIGPDYIADDSQIVTLENMPKFVYKKGRNNHWRHDTRHIEARYFTEGYGSRRSAFCHDRFNTIGNTNSPAPIVASTYITDEERVPKPMYVSTMRAVSPLEPAMVDASVGSEVPRKRVTKIRLPEMINKGTGSSDQLSPYIAQWKSQQSPDQLSVATMCGSVSPLCLSLDRRSDVMSTILPPHVPFSKNTNATKTVEVTASSIQGNDVPDVFDDSIPEKLVEKNCHETVETPNTTTLCVADTNDSGKLTNVFKDPNSELIRLFDLETRTNSRLAIDDADKEFLKILKNESKDFETNESKMNTASSLRKVESSSIVRRRFEALRMAAAKDNPVHENYVDQATSMTCQQFKDVGLSPALKPKQSCPSTNIDNNRFDYQYSEPSSSRRQDNCERRYKLKLWGHKRNKDSNLQKEQIVKRKIESPTRPLIINDPENKGNKKKSRKLFQFNKKSKTRDKNKTNRLTKRQCGISGVCLKIDGKQAWNQKETYKQIEATRDASLERFIEVIDSMQDAKVSWNNKDFKTSSTTLIEFMDTVVYQDIEFTIQPKEHDALTTINNHEDKQPNFFQNIEAYMVHKTVQNPHQRRRSLYGTRSIDRCYYECGRSRKMEFILTAQDFSLFRHSAKLTCGSADLKLQLPSLRTTETGILDNNATSEEEVFKIIEYENLISGSDLPKKYATMDKGDLVPIVVEKSSECGGNKIKGVVLRDSKVLLPEKRINVISFLMHRHKRHSRDLQSHLELDDDDNKLGSGGKLLQDVYTSWLDRFACFGKDARSCCSDDIDAQSFHHLYVIEEEGSAQSKSCPTLFDVEPYQLTPKLSVVNVNNETPRNAPVEAQPKENVAKMITERIISAFKRKEQANYFRIMPKDSVAVCKKRRKMAASLKKSQEDNNSPCSMPSHEDKAGDVQCDIELQDSACFDSKNDPMSALIEPSKITKATIVLGVSTVSRSRRQRTNRSVIVAEQIKKDAFLPTNEADSLIKSNVYRTSVCEANDSNCACTQKCQQPVDKCFRRRKTTERPMPSQYSNVPNTECTNKKLPQLCPYDPRCQYDPPKVTCKPEKRRKERCNENLHDKICNTKVTNMDRGCDPIPDELLKKKCNRVKITTRMVDDCNEAVPSCTMNTSSTSTSEESSTDTSECYKNTPETSDDRRPITYPNKKCLKAPQAIKRAEMENTSGDFITPHCRHCAECEKCSKTMKSQSLATSTTSTMDFDTQDQQCSMTSIELEELKQPRQMQDPMNHSLGTGVSCTDRGTEVSDKELKSKCTTENKVNPCKAALQKMGKKIRTKKSASKTSCPSACPSQSNKPIAPDETCSEIKLCTQNNQNKSKSSVASKSRVTRGNDVPKNKCVLCFDRPWWLGGPPSKKRCPILSKSGHRQWSVFNMIEERLQMLPTENDDEQCLSLRAEFLERLDKLDMPKIVEIDSKETMLVGNKRKTASTEEIRDRDTPEAIKTARLTGIEENPIEDNQYKYTEMHQDNDQIEINFQVKIGSGRSENVANSKVRQRYKTQPEIYVIGNEKDETKVENQNDVNIQIIIKPNSQSMNHDSSNNIPIKYKTQNSVTLEDTFGVPPSTDRSSIELSILKEELENELQSTWEKINDVKSSVSNKESRNAEQTKDKLKKESAIKPVNRTVASPFKVLHKSPVTDLEEENLLRVGAEKMAILKDDQLELQSIKNGINEVNTQATIVTESINNIYKASSRFHEETNPFESSVYDTYSGPYIRRVRTINRKPKSQSTQTYSKKVDSKHDCVCLTSAQNKKERKSNDQINKLYNKQPVSCEVEELNKDSYYEVADTETQYEKPVNCLTCFMKKHSDVPNFLAPFNYQIEHAIPIIRNLQRHTSTVPSKEHSKPERLKRKIVEDKISDLVVHEIDHMRKKRHNTPADVLQSNEAKKAVLKIYAQENVSDLKTLVAKLPEFPYDREIDIDELPKS